LFVRVAVSVIPARMTLVTVSRHSVSVSGRVVTVSICVPEVSITFTPAGETSIKISLRFTAV
jgi:hypothetical protein